MRQYLRKNIAKVTLILFAFYLVLFVDLGSGTFAEQVLRILTTPESEQLAADVYHSILRLIYTIARFVRDVWELARGRR